MRKLDINNLPFTINIMPISTLLNDKTYKAWLSASTEYATIFGEFEADLARLKKANSPFADKLDYRIQVMMRFYNTTDAYFKQLNKESLMTTIVAEMNAKLYNSMLDKDTYEFFKMQNHDIVEEQNLTELKQQQQARNNDTTEEKY